jgi:hypothetical protein
VSAIYLASTLSIPFAGVLVDRAGRRITIVLVRPLTNCSLRSLCALHPLSLSSSLAGLGRDGAHRVPAAAEHHAGPHLAVRPHRHRACVLCAARCARPRAR